MPIPDKLDTKIRDVEVASKQVLDAHKGITRAIQTGTLADSDLKSFESAASRYRSALSALIARKA